MRRLGQSFFTRDTKLVAKGLLGKYLVHVSRGVERVGRIVETEAYLGPRDLAAHSSKGLTKRTRVLFGAPGHAYIYMIYGMYYCLNIVTQKEGDATAALIRAIEPVKNIEGRTKGPGLVCKSMHIDLRLNGHDLIGDDFHVAAPAKAERFTIVTAKRMGVEYAKHWAKRRLRYYIRGNPFVSHR